MPKISLKRLPTLDLKNENKLHELRVSIPSVKSRKLTKSIIPISKAAEMLQVNPDTLRNWEKQGRLIPDRTPGGSRRYNLFELQEIQKQLNIKKETLIKTPFAGLSVSKAAKILQVSPDTIRNWDNKGLISSQRASGGARRFSKNLVMKLRGEINIDDIAAPDQAQNTVSQPPDRSDRLHHSMAIMILLLVLSGGALVGLFTGFQMMRVLDELSKNTHSIDQKMADIQEQLVAVSGVVDSAKKLSASIKLASSEFGPHLVDSEAKVLGESANLVDQIILKGNTTVQGILTAPNVIYGLVAGSNVAISGGQTPTISLKLPALVNSLNGKTGALKLTGGTDIAVDGLTINDSSTLSSVRGRGGCDNCLSDADIQDNISISSEGNVDAGAIKKGELSVEHGGTGLTSFLTGDLLIADSNNSLAALSAGNIGSTLVMGSSGKPAWSDSLIIDSTTGNVGIGTTAPAAPLEVKGTGSGAVIAKFTDQQNTGCIIATDGTISCSSDINLKKNITDINYGLSDLMQLHPVAFNWKTEADNANQSLGFIAQDVEKVFPKLVTNDAQTGLKSLNTIGLVPVLTKSIQELNTWVKGLEDKLALITLDQEGKVVLPEAKMDQLVLSSDIPINGALMEDQNTKLQIQNENTLGLGAEVATNSARLDANIESQRAQLAQTQSQLDDLKIKVASISAVIASGATRLSAPERNDGGQEQSSISSEQIATDSASPRNDRNDIANLNLTPPSILLSTASAQLNLQPPTESTLSGTMLTYETATFSKTLKSLGETLVGTVIAAGDIVQDGTLSFSGGNTINAMPTLYVQSSDLASLINFFNGMVTIDKTGTLTAQAVTLSELKVKGNKISGNAKIASGTKSIEIDNSVVSARSRILVTPTTETDTVLAVTSKEDNKKFTVTASKNVPQDITFDWWLINEVD